MTKFHLQAVCAGAHAWSPRARPTALPGPAAPSAPSRRPSIENPRAEKCARWAEKCHHRSDWAELTISMGSRDTMSDRESSCRNARRGPGPGFEYGFSLDPESTSQRAIADERSQASVSVGRMCHSRLLNSDPNNKKHLPFALSATPSGVLLSARHNLHPHRTAK